MKWFFTVALAVGLLGAAASAVYIAREHGSGRRSGGPLECGECARTAMGIQVRVGQPATFGVLGLRNSDVRPAVLEAVRLLDVDPGLDVIDMLVIEPDGSAPLIGVDAGFPPSSPGGRTFSVTGYAVAPSNRPEEFVQVLIGATIRKRGIVGARRIAVDYRINGRRYRAVFPYSIWLCAPGDVPKRGCVGPGY